jgi:hypothetical protein
MNKSSNKCGVVYFLEDSISMRDEINFRFSSSIRSDWEVLIRVWLVSFIRRLFLYALNV